MSLYCILNTISVCVVFYGQSLQLVFFLYTDIRCGFASVFSGISLKLFILSEQLKLSVNAFVVSVIVFLQSPPIRQVIKLVFKSEFGFLDFIYVKDCISAHIHTISFCFI